MIQQDDDVVKLVVVVPVTHADQLRQALGDAGVGVIGNYHHCSFTVVGVGRFIPGEGAQPFIGEVGKPEQVQEERIETPCPKTLLPLAIQTIQHHHPYEEPVIEVYPLIDISDLLKGGAR